MTHLAQRMETEFQDFTAYEAFYNGFSVVGAVDANRLVHLQRPGFEMPVISLGTTEGSFGISLDAIIQRVRESLVCEEWRSLIVQKNAATDTRTLQITARRAFAAIHDGGPSAIDLRLLQQDNVNGEHLAMLLRVISTWKAQLPGWERAVAIAKDALIIEGKDPEDALFGIL